MQRRADAHAADLGRALGRERVEVVTGVDVVALRGRELHDRRSLLRVAPSVRITSCRSRATATNVAPVAVRSARSSARR